MVSLSGVLPGLEWMTMLFFSPTPFPHSANPGLIFVLWCHLVGRNRKTAQYVSPVARILSDLYTMSQRLCTRGLDGTLLTAQASKWSARCSALIVVPEAMGSDGRNGVLQAE